VRQIIQALFNEATFEINYMVIRFFKDEILPGIYLNQF